MNAIKFTTFRQRKPAIKFARIYPNLRRFLSINLLVICLTGISIAQKIEETQVKKESDQPMHCHEESKAEPNNNPAKPKLTIPEVEVLTQDGKQVAFFKDLIKGKKVLINFIYTSCNLTCPMAGRNFSNLQKHIEKVGEDLVLISVSTDPAFDTPEILKKWGEKFGRHDGWTLVTGEEKKLKDLLIALTGSGPQRGLHTSLLILFDEKTGAWETTSSLRNPELLLDDMKKLGKTGTK